MQCICCLCRKLHLWHAAFVNPFDFYCPFVLKCEKTVACLLVYSQLKKILVAIKMLFISCSIREKSSYLWLLLIRLNMRIIVFAVWSCKDVNSKEKKKRSKGN